MTRTTIIVVAIAASLAIIAATIGALVHMGAEGERLKDTAADAVEALGASEANASAARGAAEAGDQHARTAARLQGEAADGRREIERHAAAPAPDTVGPRAMVDPGFALGVLRCVGRLRGDAEAEGAACRAAATEPQ